MEQEQPKNCGSNWRKNLRTEQIQASWGDRSKRAKLEERKWHVTRFWCSYRKQTISKKQNTQTKL
jgi:hypothetical protein